MLSKTELEEIRARMEEEHRLDIAALERITRFLPQNGNGHTATATPAAVNGHDPNSSLLLHDDSTISGAIEALLKEKSNRTWTVQQVLTELALRNTKPSAKNPQATVSVAIKKLNDRGLVTLVRAGSGRQPHIYQWKQVDISECEISEGEA